MIKNKIANRSIIIKLLVPTILVFTVMMILSSYLIGKKQEQLSNDFEQQVISKMTESGDADKHLYLLINEAQILTTAEYRVFAAFVMGGSVLFGGFILAFIIVRILSPLKELTEKVNQIDINNIPDLRKNIVPESGSYEIRNLSLAFHGAFSKIYSNYEKQKQFSTNVSHELRTPLAVILTKIDVFKKHAVGKDPETVEFIGTIEKSIIRLSKLVEDILFISRDYKPSSKAVSLREIADEVVLDLEEKAEEKQINLTVAGDEISIFTDDTLLERAIYNLVDNAIKYTQSGGECRIEIGRDDCSVSIAVKDNGPGIPDSHKNSVFDLFYRVETSRNRKTGGCGVGLALVREVVRRMGGTIEISDNQPSGSIFRIIFPLNPDISQ